MAYASGAVSDIIERVQQHFNSARKAEFTKLNLVSSWYWMAINESLDELHHECLPQPEEFTVTTVVSQAEYPMDLVGTPGHLSDEIGIVNDVDYDGTRLPYRYLYPEQITPWVTGNDDGAPDGWYVTWKSGVRYLGLAAEGVAIGPDEAVTVRVYALRIPTALAADATVLKIERDFLGLVKFMVIAKVYELMEDFEKASWWLEKRVNPGKYELKVQTQERLGRTVDQITILGPGDIYE